MSLTRPHSTASQTLGGDNSHKLGYRRSRSYHEDHDPKRASTSSSLTPQQSPRRRAQSTSKPNATSSSSQSNSNSSKPRTLKRSSSSEKYNGSNQHGSPLAYERGHPLAPIPGSPYATDTSPPPSPTAERSRSRASQSSSRHSKQKIPPMPSNPAISKGKDSPQKTTSDGIERSRSSKSTKSHLEFVPYRAPQPQSLNAALEKIAQSGSPSSSMSSQEKKGDVGKEKEKRPSGTMDEWGARLSISLGRASGQRNRQRISTDTAGISSNAKTKSVTAPSSPTRDNKEAKAQASQTQRDLKHQPSVSPSVKSTKSASPSNGSMPRVVGKDISAPVFDAEATNNMNPVKLRNAGRPILVPQPHDDGKPPVPVDGSEPLGPQVYFPKRRTSTLNTG